MIPFPDSGSWFVCFPDYASEKELGALLEPYLSFSLADYSGQPWLVGRQPAQHVVCAERGADVAAAVGEGAAAAVQHLEGLLISSPSYPSTAMNRGSTTSVYRSGGATYARGPLSNLTGVFYGAHPRGPVLSDNPAVLAWLLGAHMDRDMLAWGLLSPAYTPEFTSRSYWQGIYQVPAGYEAVVLPRGEVTLRSWWTPPTPSLPLADGAEQVRRELEEAVDVRLDVLSQQTPVSADLSGGTDSSSLALLAAARSAHRTVHTFAIAPEGSDHEDAQWAERAASSAGTKHCTLTRHDLAEPYDGTNVVVTDLARRPELLFAPYTLVRNIQRKIAYSDHIAATGSALHFGGFGGDELFTPPLAGLHDRSATHPFDALRKARSYGHVRRWRASDIAAELTRREGFEAWVNQARLGPIRNYPPANYPHMGWGVVPRAPVWVTERAIASVRSVLRRSPVPSPASPLRGTHTVLSMLRRGGNRLRGLRALKDSAGVTYALPFMDDRVITAALAVDQHADQWIGHDYKAVLKAAMAVYDTSSIFNRQSKGEFSQEVYSGLARNEHHLTALFTNSRLAQLGLIDDEVVRRVLVDRFRFDHQTTALEQTIATEIWLRSIQ